MKEREPDISPRERCETQKFERALAKLNEIKDNPAALARAGRQAGTFQKFVSAWKLGMISGFRTAEVVWLSHLLYLGTRLSRDTVAATLGSAFKTEGGLRLPDAMGMFVGSWKGALDGIKMIGALYKSDAMDVFARSEAAKEAGVKGVTAADLMGQEPAQADITTPVPFTSRLGKLAEMLTSKTHVAAYTLFRTMNERAEAYMQAQRIIREQGTWQYGEDGYWDAVHMLANNPTAYMEQRIGTMGARGAFQEKQAGGIVETINAAKMKHPWLNFIVPFTTVPGSIFRESARLSPFAPFVGKWREDFMAGGEARDRAIVEFGAGTALALGAWYMASNGNITGRGGPDPRQRSADQAAGKLPYSVVVNGNYYQYQRMSMPGVLLGLVADVHDAWHLMDTPEREKVWQTLAFGFTNATINQTWMKGLADTVNALSDPTRSGAKMAEGFISSVVPAASAQTASEMDPYVRDVSGVLDAIRNRIPGHMFGIGRETLQPAYDIFGQPKANVMEGAVSPMASSEIAPDKVRTEASRLGYAGPVAPSPAPQSLPVSFPGRPADARMKLTQEQRGNFAQTAGKQAYDVLAPQVNSPAWDQMPEMAKRMVYQKAFRMGHFRAAVESVPIDQRAQAIGQLQQEYLGSEAQQP